MQNDQKKILFIIDNLSTGGAQRQMVQLATGLKHRGFEVNVFCYQEGDLLAQPLYDENIPVFWHKKKSRFSLDVIFSIRKLINKMRYNLVISFLTTPNFYAILCCQFLGRRIPVVISERRADLPTGPERIERLIRPLYRFASHLVVNSHHQRESLIRAYPRIKGKISTIYNGYVLDKFQQPTMANRNGSLALLVVASVGPHKNGLCLIEALKILRDDYANTPTVDWIGQQLTVGEYGAYLAVMNQKITDYKIGVQWNWMGQRTDVIDQMHRHDVLIHPSYVEGLPNVVCEALASSLPVIVSNTLDHPMLVQDGESGFLFDYQDPADLAAKIMKFSDLTPEKRKQMGKNGREYAENNLGNERFIASYENLIHQICKVD